MTNKQVLSRSAQNKNCIFCLDNKLINETVLFQNEHHFFLRSIDKILTCSGVIIPFRHVESPLELTKEEWLSLNDIIQEAKKILDKENPDGYNLGWNIGKTAGQEINHAHLHIIGRFNDEPLAGKGIRSHIKSEANKRPKK